MRHLFILLLLLASFTCKSQEEVKSVIMQPPIPMEVFGGVKSSMYQMIVAKNLTNNGKLGFFNLLKYEVDYDNKTPDSYIIQSLTTYKLAKRINVGAGVNLKAFGGFHPFVSTSYSVFNKNIGFLIQPSYEIGNNGEKEIFSLFEWHPTTMRRWSPYFRLQALVAFRKQHSFSYHYWRTGIQFKKIRFGPAFNAQYFGSSGKSDYNFGAFFSVLID